MQDQHPLQQTSYPPASPQSLEQVQEELRQQRKLIEENHHMLRSMRRSLHVTTILSMIRLLLLLIPLILALVFLPPLIKQWTGVIREYQDTFSVQGNIPTGFDINKIQDLLQNSGLLER